MEEREAILLKEIEDVELIKSEMKVALLSLEKVLGMDKTIGRSVDESKKKVGEAKVGSSLKVHAKLPKLEMTKFLG